METMLATDGMMDQELQPLRASVKQAINKYFNQIGDGPIANLYDLVLSEIEGPMLKAVMEHTRQNQSRAAILLGMSRGTLRKKLRQHGIIK